jgi:hypothetical protein
MSLFRIFTLLRNAIILFGLVACNEASIPIPDQISGQVVEQLDGSAIPFADIEVYIFEKRLLNFPGPEGMPKDRIARFVHTQTDLSGRFVLNLHQVKAEISKTHSGKEAAMSKLILIKGRGYKEFHATYQESGQVFSLIKSSN